MTLLCWVLAMLYTAAQDGKVDPPGTAVYMARFRVLFASWDANRDGSLDKEELAKAFRGPYARPFDHVALPRTVLKDNSEKDRNEKDRSEKAKRSDEAKPTGKKDYSRFPDYNFLVQLDTDNDEKISREEFENWGRDLSTQQKMLDDTVRQQLALQTRLNQPRIKPADKKKLKNDLREVQDQSKRAQDRQKQLERNFIQAQKKANEKPPPRKTR